MFLAPLLMICFKRQLCFRKVFRTFSNLWILWLSNRLTKLFTQISSYWPFRCVVSDRSPIVIVSGKTTLTTSVSNFVCFFLGAKEMFPHCIITMSFLLWLPVIRKKINLSQLKVAANNSICIVRCSIRQHITVLLHCNVIIPACSCWVCKSPRHDIVVITDRD